MTDFTWSSRPRPGTFIAPYGHSFYAKGDNKAKDKDRGPSMLGDANEGLIKWTWQVTYNEETGDVIVFREDIPDDKTIIFTKPDITYISLTFDQNGRQFIAYQVEPAGVLPKIWIYWYDPTLPAFTHTELDSGNTPFCRLDYKVSNAEINNTIGVFYQRDGVIYHRYQSDRYATEELVLTAINTNLLNTVAVGFTHHNRFQLMYEDEPYNTTAALYPAPEDFILVYKGHILTAAALPADYYAGALDIYKVITFKLDYPLANTITNSFSINSINEPTETFSVYISERLGSTEGCTFASVTSGSFVDYSTCNLTAGTSYYIHIIAHQTSDGYRVTFS